MSKKCHLCVVPLPAVHADILEINAFWTDLYTPRLQEDVSKDDEPSCCVISPSVLGDLVSEGGVDSYRH
jgi:hypothetical protein